jgi:cation:H+ antiporter
LKSNLARQWLTIAAAVLVAAPSPILRLLETVGGPHPELSPAVEAAIFGIAILAAASLLSWAAEVAETEISQTLALAFLALIAVLPEYAVDLFFAWTAPDNPENAAFALANMTGANRLLVGFAWPLIFLIFWLKTKGRHLPVDRHNSVGIIFLGVATLYVFTIPFRAHLSLIDTLIMFTLFGGYLYLSSRTPAREVEEFVGPAAAIAELSTGRRRAVVAIAFLFAAVVIFAAAEPFAEGLVDTGRNIGFDEFIMVQLVAPLASEAPEFLLAGFLAARGRAGAGMTILIASKVNQWTLLIGSLPLAFSISGTTLSPLEFDARQQTEVFLTAGQSLFAVAIFTGLSLAWWEAGLLAVLYTSQLFFLDNSVRIGYSSFYLLLALMMFLRERPFVPDLWRAARETVVQVPVDNPGVSGAPFPRPKKPPGAARGG